MNPTEPISNAFYTLLQNHRDGAVLNELTDAMRAAGDAAEQTGKPATFTLSFTMTPTGGGAFAMSDDIKTKLPQLPKRASIFFRNPETGMLQRDNPSQLKLELRAVTGGVAEEMPLREVRPASAANQ